MSPTSLPGLPPEVRFALRPGLRAAELRERLASKFRLQERGSFEQRVEYLDTPDWRLMRARMSLARHAPLVTQGNTRGASQAGAHRGRSVHELVLETEDGVERIQLGRAAEFHWELPDGPLRERVRTVAAVRRLVPQVNARVAVTRLEVLDGREKIVVRLDVLEGTALERGEHPLPTTVRVEPLRGYEEERDALVEFLAAEAEAAPADGSIPDGSGPHRSSIAASFGAASFGAASFGAASTLGAAVRALGRDPRAGRLVWRVELDPTAPAGVEVRRALARLLDNLRAAEPGVLDDVDTEFLHDFRVAVRRTRSILSHSKSVLSADELAHFRGEFAWLGRATSAVRDLDVLLLAAHGRAGSVAGTDPDELVPLQRHLARRRRKAYGRLAEILRSARYHYLVEAWTAFLALPSTDDPPAAVELVARFAAKRIAKQHARVAKGMQGIDEEAPSERVHALRIECKKLRYLLDAFGGLFAVQDVARVTKRLKQLQGALGDFNDAEVQRVLLRELAGELKDPPVETLLAIGRAIERLAQRSGELRPKLAQRMAAFQRDVDREALEALVSTLRGARGGADEEDEAFEQEPGPELDRTEDDPA